MQKPIPLDRDNKATPAIPDRSPTIYGRFSQRSRYKAMCVLFIALGVLVELLAVSSVSPYVCFLPLILFGLLGALTCCPMCEAPIGYFPEDAFLSDSWERCCNCGRLTAQKAKQCIPEQPVC